MKDAYIDIEVQCRRCGGLLYCGAYSRRRVKNLKILIHQLGWKHHPTEGTLCPDCIKEIGEKDK